MNMKVNCSTAIGATALFFCWFDLNGVGISGMHLLLHTCWFSGLVSHFVAGSLAYFHYVLLVPWPSVTLCGWFPGLVSHCVAGSLAQFHTFSSQFWNEVGMSLGTWIWYLSLELPHLLFISRILCHCYHCQNDNWFTGRQHFSHHQPHHGC